MRLPDECPVSGELWKEAPWHITPLQYNIVPLCLVKEVCHLGSSWTPSHHTVVILWLDTVWFEGIAGKGQGRQQNCHRCQQQHPRFACKAKITTMTSVEHFYCSLYWSQLTLFRVSDKLEQTENKNAQLLSMKFFLSAFKTFNLKSGSNILCMLNTLQ